MIGQGAVRIDGERVADREQFGQMDFPTQPLSGDFQVHTEGYSDGSVTIEQDIPFPTHVVGLFGQIQVNDS